MLCMQAADHHLVTSVVANALAFASAQHGSPRAFGPRDGGVPPTVIANEVKQSMSLSLHRREVVGFRERAAWVATGLMALSMNRLRFKVRVQFQTHRNRRLAMTV